MAESSLLVVIDIETTGLGRADRAVEFACEVIDVGGAVATRYETLIDPGRPPGPTRVHGISRQVLEGAPAFREVAGDIQRLLRDRVVVGHNLSFDWAMLRSEMGRLGVDVPSAPRGICTAQLARVVYGRRSPAGLGAVCRRLGIDHAHAHRAAYDVAATAQIYRYLRDDLDRLPTFRPCAPFGRAWRLPLSTAPFPRHQAGLVPFRQAPGEPLEAGS